MICHSLTPQLADVSSRHVPCCSMVGQHIDCGGQDKEKKRSSSSGIRRRQSRSRKGAYGCRKMHSSNQGRGAEDATVCSGHSGRSTH
jgi:hypothetical protein